MIEMALMSIKPSKLYARCCLDTAAQEAVENAALFGMALQRYLTCAVENS
jgi:hypothetical protein